MESGKSPNQGNDFFFFPYPSVSSNRRSSEEGRRSFELGKRRQVAVVSGWLGKISVSSQALPSFSTQRQSLNALCLPSLPDTGPLGSFPSFIFALLNFSPYLSPLLLPWCPLLVSLSHLSWSTLHCHHINLCSTQFPSFHFLTSHKSLSPMERRRHSSDWYFRFPMIWLAHPTLPTSPDLLFLRGMFYHPPPKP